MAATIYLPQEALAKVQKGEAEIVITKTFSKEELSATLPANPVPDFTDKIQENVANFFKNTQANQNASGSKLLEIYNAAPFGVNEEEKYLMDRSTLREVSELKTDRKENMDSVRDYLRKEPGKFIGNQIVAKSKLLQSIRSGFNFTLDIGKIFRPKEEAAKGNIRYGLVIRDIRPGDDAIKKAAIGDRADEMQYAGHADVQWSIGPLDNSGTGKPFAFNEQIGAVPTHEQPASLWDNIKIPSMAFKSAVSPIEGDYFSMSKDVVPSISYSLTQVDGLYQFNRSSKLNMDTISTEHLVNLPVAEKTHIGRRFDDHWRPLETWGTTHNVIVNKNAPMVGIHYYHLDDRFMAQTNKDLNGHTISFKAEMPSHWKPSLELGHPGEKYSVGYGRVF